MIDVIEQFYDKLVLSEIKKRLKIQSNLIKDSSNTELKNADFPDSLNELYRQIDVIEILWQISNGEKGEELKNQLQQDPWLKENYWNEGYGWGIIEEYLSGFINIQKLEDMLNPEYCKDERFYYTLDLAIEDENPDDYIPFDIHWSLTACLKRENGKILDNIWLVHADADMIVDMNVSISRYVELCYKAKGFHYWQLAYYHQDEAYEYSQLMKRFLPILFPDVELDLADFGIENNY